jgi:hypothetical protein
VVYFWINKKLTTRKSVSCGIMSKLQGDNLAPPGHLAVSPEVAIESVVQQGRLATASVYADYGFNRSASKKVLHQYSHDLLYYSPRTSWVVNGIGDFYNLM